ncbi:glycoside hydrolase family 44 protein [Capsulimonas corticalis]|uniref:glycoside hydrolase family 44 protein n=1 Tax=Capsulimonas corticalis TaxID=2219043 RepID=UPI000FF927DC|nr:glycoside hydrolase family 44 protein [Capsulimonas corticalis]
MLAVPAMLLTGPAARSQDLAIYTDSLQNGWQNWSWATTDLGNGSPVHAGADSISVTAGGWAALYLHSNPIDTSPYTSLSFWINGGPTGGQLLQVAADRNGGGQAGYQLSPLTSGWQQITIPLSALGVADVTDFDGFYIQDRTGTSQPTFYVDDISLIGLPIGSVSIDAAANVHPISPYIYGINWGSPAQLLDMNSRTNRGGGNTMSTYNWKNNASNHAADWFFESLGGSSTVPGDGEDSFITSTKSANAEPMVTIPTLGWVAKEGPNGERYASFSVAKYGAQTSTDPWWPDAGNGYLLNGSAVTGNDPNDAFVPSDVNYIKPDLARIVSKFGQAANGGVKFYILDNEVDAWHSTHRDAHPVGATIDEMLNDTEAYGSAVKAADPTAKVVGLEVWNWTGCFTSGYDAQHGQGTDRSSHGNMDVYPYILQQLKAYEQATGVRALDYLSIHFYPQGNDASGDNSVANQLLRNRATRQLWDRNYTSESWMNTKIYAIPHLKDWINTYYPGTKTAITEYNWGVENTMNGATTMADELGVFGREGLDIATRWGVPASPSYEAFKLYTNYDGNKSTFGDTSVGATVVNPDYLSTFAAIRSSDGALTIMVINKTLSGTTPVTLNIANFKAASSSHVWQVSSPAIVQQPDVPVTSGTISLTVPASSITLFVVPTLTSPILKTLTASASAVAGANLTAYATLQQPAPVGGAHILISSSSPAISSGMIVIPAGASSGSTALATHPVAADALVTLSAPSGDATKSVNAAVLASFQNIAFAAPSGYGGLATAIGVALSGPAPAGGVTVTLSSSDSKMLPAGTRFTIPAGSSGAWLKVTPTPVTSDTVVTATATLGSVTKSASYTVKPATLQSVTAPATVNAGLNITVRAYLTGPAPAGGIAVPVVSSSAAITGSTISVPAGAVNGSGVFGSHPVAADTLVTLTGSVGGVTKSANVTVLASLQTIAFSAPSGKGGVSAAIGVALSGPAPAGGVTVTLSSSDSKMLPAGTQLTIPAGSYGVWLRITPSKVSADTIITATAMLGSSSKTASYTVTGP